MDSERLFSAVSNVLDEKRNRLAADRVEMLIFLKKNLHLIMPEYESESGKEGEESDLW